MLTTWSDLNSLHRTCACHLEQSHFPIIVKPDSELHIDKDFIVLFPACLCESLLALLIVLGNAASKDMVQGYSGPTPKQQGPSQIRAHADRSQPGAQVPGVHQLLDVEQTTADHFVRLFCNLHAIVIRDSVGRLSDPVRHRHRHG